MFQILKNYFEKLIYNKDIRSFKKNLLYYIIFRIIRNKLKKDIIIKIYNFYIFASYKKNIQSHSILRKCDFEDDNELDLINQISKKNKILLIDCGANFGFYSLFVASLSKENKVFSIEASPSTFKNLLRNINLNKFKNIQVLNYAVSNQNNSELSLAESENDWESSVSHKNFNILNSTKIQTIKLDSLLKEFNNEIFDFSLIIKLDVEGHEWNAIEGALQIIKTYSPLIIIEFSKFINEANYESIEKFLNQNDYEVYDTKNKKISIEIVKKRLNSLPKGMMGIGNNFLIKKKTAFENFIK